MTPTAQREQRVAVPRAEGKQGKQVERSPVHSRAATTPSTAPASPPQPHQANTNVQQGRQSDGGTAGVSGDLVGELTKDQTFCRVNPPQEAHHETGPVALVCLGSERITTSSPVISCETHLKRPVYSEIHAGRPEPSDGVPESH